MRAWQSTAGLIALFCVACAGLPPKTKPTELAATAPLDLDAGGGEWPAKQWWKRYQDPTLDQLIALAMESSPTLATAHARFDSARQSVRIAGAASGGSRGTVLISAEVISPRLVGRYTSPPGGSGRMISGVTLITRSLSVSV